MSPEVTVADRIFEAVRCTPDCTLEELMLSSPDLSCPQVFLEVDT